MNKHSVALRFSAFVAVLALASSASVPAGATITNQPASNSQGTLVHDPGATVDGTDVKGDLGEGGPQIVNFDGDTTQTGSLFDMLELKKGDGQADITGAEIAGPGNNFYPFLSGDIYLDGHAGMTWIELALTGTGNPGGGSVSFYLTDGNGIVSPFLNLLLGNGDTHYGFQADGGDVITNLRFVANDPPGSIDLIKQVRITAAAAVPEPASWALMLMGFGGIGAAMRRSRKRVLAQIA